MAGDGDGLWVGFNGSRLLLCKGKGVQSVLTRKRLGKRRNAGFGWLFSSGE